MYINIFIPHLNDATATTLALIDYMTQLFLHFDAFIAIKSHQKMLVLGFSRCNEPEGTQRV